MKQHLILFSLVTVLLTPLIACNKVEEQPNMKVSFVPVMVSREKWSFVNENGEVLFEDEFKTQPTVVYNGCFGLREGEKLSLNKIKGDRYDVVGDMDGLISLGYMEEDLIPATLPNQRIVVYDKNGKKKFELTPVNSQEVLACSAGFSDGALRFTVEDGRIGFFDNSGKVLIKPNYSWAGDFSEGLAVVRKDDSDSYLVINKKGDTVFRLKSGQYPSSNYFENGFLIVRDEERTVLYDKKGEIVKFPSKIKYIQSTNGKYVIFANEDYELGVADMKGEVIIRPKYNHIEFDGNNFMAVRDDECMILNASGEELSKWDYKMATPYGKFGYFVYSGSRYALVNGQGKEKGKEDFYEINLSQRSFNDIVTSDYFDVNAVAKSLTDIITSNGVGEYKLGSSASSVFNGMSADRFTYSSYYSMDEVLKEGFGYNITLSYLRFSQTMATGYWDEGYYSNYVTSWNPESKLYEIDLKVEARKELGKAEYDALSSALQTAGYTSNKKGFYRDDNAALFSKGNLAILIQCPDESDYCFITLIDKNFEPGKEKVEELMHYITKKRGESPVWTMDTVEVVSASIYD